MIFETGHDRPKFHGYNYIEVKDEVYTMTTEDGKLKQLLRINAELIQLCKWLNERARYGDFIPSVTACGRLDPHSDRGGQEQTTLKG